jgi:hypothetical protein
MGIAVRFVSFPGAILRTMSSLISETVWQAVNDKLDGATSIGAGLVKGREEPIQLWQVV